MASNRKTSDKVVASKGSELGKLDASKWISVPIEKLVKADWNYKPEDEENQRVLVNGIKKNGQVENIIVRELAKGRFEIVNGNHRYDAFVELEFKNAVAYNLGAIGLAEAKLIAVETNETRFRNDESKLAQLLKSISITIPIDKMSETLPMSKDLIEDKIKALDFSFDNFKKEEKGLSGDKDGDGGDWKTVSLRLPADVADQFNEQVDRFKKALHPEEKDLSRVSPVLSVEAMLQHLAQLDDDHLIG